jgi:hypothetical protein
VKGVGIMSPKSPDNTERINVFFSKAVLKQLKIEAKERGMTVSGFVRMIVLEWLKGGRKHE